MSFASDVSRITKDMRIGSEKLAAAVFIELFSAVIRDTPKNTGRLQGNWITTSKVPASGTTNSTGTSKPISLAQITVRKPDLYYLVNNLPYAEVAEFGTWGKGPGATAKTGGTGFSIQAPAGMVRKNVKRLDSILRRKSI